MKRVLTILFAAAVFLAAIFLWRDPWAIPAARQETARYQLAAYWDGDVIPSGEFVRPIGVAAAPNGDIYVTDATPRLVRLSEDGGFLGEWGGQGDGPGEFSNPIGIAVGPDGMVYVSDFDQDRIQKFAPDGQFIDEFGGPGTAAGEFDSPSGLAFDGEGSLYVAEFYNHRVQKLTSDGASRAIIGHSGRTGAGALYYPTAVAITPAGNLLVADAYNYQLQWFTLTGDPLMRRGYHVFWLWPLRVSSEKGFNVPTGAATDADGLIHVADSANHRIVMLSPDGAYITEWVLEEADPNVFSPEHIAVSADGTTVYATDLAGNRVIVLEVVR